MKKKTEKTGGVLGVSPRCLQRYMHGYMLIACNRARTLSIHANTNINHARLHAWLLACLLAHTQTVIMQIVCKPALDTIISILQQGSACNCCLHALPHFPIHAEFLRILACVIFHEVLNGLRTFQIGKPCQFDLVFVLFHIS